MVTQCPACGSRFRITGTQLGRAGGRVRCGACLAVFLAPDSLSGDEETAPGATSATDGIDGIESREGVGEGAGFSQAGGRAADVPKGAGEVRSIPGEPRLARGAPDSNRWVRWALVVAVLILFLQLALYLT
ncbi:MAG: zinc-ribbon domain-containing protein [Gammaproteobacteria bacterium]|nr:zinc-ribbon domain-containing protein [Gammaproteobacteria bacterium]MDE0367214.1 zinc-ribbon domain-containing protein [Gammaproteobacteria bacterium]